MIDVGALGLSLLSCLAMLSTAGGVALSLCLPWSDPAHRARMPVTFGIALGPFLFGIAALVVLAILSGAGHAVHLAAAILILAALLALALRLRPNRPAIPRPARAIAPAEFVLIGAWIASGGAVLIIAIFTPLTQNDSLEYAMVGRILFETGSLWSYPVLDPETNASGFFGPWTHPPLYVASIYLTSVIQGHAEAPGAIRLISPWFLLAGSGVVFSLGSLVGRTTGLSAAIFFLSTPLLFLGAGSALLDATYVTGFAVLVAAIVGVNARPVARGAIIGAVVGLGLWTHSVAILFLPLMLVGLVLHRGLKDIVRLLPEAAAAFAAALLVGAWHYGRNVALFGTPVSDNPAVFALPDLHWDDYFLINRGLGTTASMIQYGILKGWFAPEAFGVTYWAMTVGFAIVLVAALRGPLWQTIWRGSATHEPPTAVLHLALGLFIAYTAGAVLSVLIGLDIMVKNERYVLVMQSVVAIGAGYGFVTVLDAMSRLGAARAVRFAGIAVFVGGALLQVSVFTSYAVARNGQTFADIGRREFSAILSDVGEYELTDYLRESTPPDALVLSIKPADMYYADRRMVSYLDERLIDFYRVDDVAEGARMLGEMGITHVHVPDYGIPPLYNSTLHEILRSPAFSDLLMSSDRGQIYALRPDDKTEGEPIDISPAARPWTRVPLGVLGGRKRFFTFPLGEPQPVDNARSEVGRPSNFFARDMAILLQVDETSGLELENVGSSEIETEVAFDMRVSGSGLIEIFVDQIGNRSSDYVKPFIETTRIVTMELIDEKGARSFSRRLSISENTDTITVSIIYYGLSSLEVKELSATGIY